MLPLDWEKRRYCIFRRDVLYSKYRREFILFLVCEGILLLSVLYFEIVLYIKKYIHTYVLRCVTVADT
jgi:hypothetical protein